MTGYGLVRVAFGICMILLRIATKNFSQDSLCPSWDSNQTHPKWVKHFYHSICLVGFDISDSVTVSHFHVCSGFMLVSWLSNHSVHCLTFLEKCRMTVSTGSLSVLHNICLLSCCGSPKPSESYCHMSGFRDKKWMGSGLGEAVYWISRSQLQLQSLRNHVFQMMRPD
jgi:hypothetical protein